MQAMTEARLGWAGQGNDSGESRLGKARHGMAMADARLVYTRLFKARQSNDQGEARLGWEWQGTGRQPRRDKARLGKARQ
jgi:hypothetical protein